MRRFPTPPDLGLRGNLYLEFWKLNYNTTKAYRDEEWFKLMVKSNRVYAHVAASVPDKNLCYNFTYKGRAIKRDAKSRDSDIKIIVPKIIAKRLYTQLEIPVESSFSRPNHIKLLTRGYDDSDKLDPETGYPKYFCCSTYIAWCLRLPKYNHYSCDELFNYITNI